jgi:hypothetical protein
MGKGQPLAPVAGTLHAVIARHAGEGGDARELVLLAGRNGTRLLVDRGVCDSADVRLLAHLAHDEPDANAAAVCNLYLADSSRACRRLRASDLAFTPGEGTPPPPEHGSGRASASAAVLTDVAGARYRLAPSSGTPAELRWQCVPHRGARPVVVSAREVVAALEDYEPVCAMTRAAIARHRPDRSVSIATLHLELRRLEASPIVLNRRLREAVVEAVSGRGISLSAIAIACGRVKRDRHGNGSGETSWLARRIGLLPEARRSAKNPWVHSDTLALIARDGLGIAPREVELR